MSRLRPSAVGQASANQQLERLFNLYDVQKNRHVCTTDFDFVHSLAQQFISGSACDSTPVVTGSKRGRLRVADGSIGQKGNASKPCLLRGQFSEEYAKATFSNVDLDSDGCISRHDFHSWITGLMDRMSKCNGPTCLWTNSLILVQHVANMLQADKRFLAYRSLALWAKREAEQDDSKDSRQMFVATATFQEALSVAEGIIKDNEMLAQFQSQLTLSQLGIIKDMLAQFQSQLTLRQLDLKHKLQTALAAAESLQDRESALREVAEAKSLLLLEPRELIELRQYQDVVKASQRPFTIHISTLAGPEAYVEVSPEDSVWSLRMKAAAELQQGPHAYQITLSNMHGKLEDDSAILRECLLCLSEGEEMVATYAKEWRW